MKKGVLVVFFLGVLLILPLIFAQEQTQTEEQIKIYSGFNRFIDNVKLVFSGGDNKVRLALKIREKEIDSAIENNRNENNEEATENLEKAWKKLQVVQEKVSANVAGEVKENSNKIKNKINDEESLSDDFELYVLEEEKTGLKAEWMIEIEGKEGQTLERGVEVTGNGSERQTKVREIETRMGEIDVEIKEWVVDSFDKTVDGDDGLTRVVANKIVKTDGDDGLTRDIKTYVAGDGTDKNVVDNDVAPGPDGIVGYQGDSDYDADGNKRDDMATTDDSGTVDQGDYAEGTTADGDSGTEGTNDVAPAVDSNEGDSEESSDGGETDSDSSEGGDSGITGEIIKNSDSGNLIKRIFDWLF